MRTAGKITHWNAEKGYGFLTPSAGAKQVFVHISAFRKRNYLPEIGQLVTFELSTDRQGRPCAVRVSLTGEDGQGKIKRNEQLLMIGCALFFLVIVGLSVMAGAIPLDVFVAYLSLSAITFFIYLYDKSAARSKDQRVPEHRLHLLSLLGGWPGALIAQQAFRHKTIKQSFRKPFWVTVMVNCAIFAWLFSDSGATVLQALLA